MIEQKLAIIIPTFRETLHIQRVVGDLKVQTFRNFKVVVINSNPGDETSRYLRSIADDRISEIPADPQTYWTQAVCLGMRWVQEHLIETDYLLLMNCDVEISPYFLEKYLSVLPDRPSAMFSPVTKNGPRYVSSGVKMKSWFLSLTIHKYMGTGKEQLPNLTLVDMLAGRALLFPVSLIEKVGFPNFKALPHYGGDYEFSARAKRNGYKLYIYSGVEVELDAKNTGRKSYLRASSIRKRFSYLFDVKSPMNLRYRLNFTILTYPKTVLIPGIATVVLKTLIEVLFGRVAHRLYRPNRLQKESLAIQKRGPDSAELNHQGSRETS